MDAVYDKNHAQIPDPTPVELPLGYSHPPTLQQQIALMIHAHEQLAKAQYMDTEEEANDFDIDDEEFAGDSRHVYTELQEEELKQLETAYKTRASRVPATDERDQDDDGDPLPIEPDEPPAPRPVQKKPGFKQGKNRAKRTQVEDENE